MKNKVQVDVFYKRNTLNQTIYKRNHIIIKLDKGEKYKVENTDFITAYMCPRQLVKRGNNICNSKGAQSNKTIR